MRFVYLSGCLHLSLLLSSSLFAQEDTSGCAERLQKLRDLHARGKSDSLVRLVPNYVETCYRDTQSVEVFDWYQAGVNRSDSEELRKAQDWLARAAVLNKEYEPYFCLAVSSLFKLLVDTNAKLNLLLGLLNDDRCASSKAGIADIYTQLRNFQRLNSPDPDLLDTVHPTLGELGYGFLFSSRAVHPASDRTSLVAKALRNPFDNTLVLEVDAPVGAGVSCMLFDLLGRSFGAMHYRATEQSPAILSFDCRQMPTGIYFARLAASSHRVATVRVQKR